MNLQDFANRLRELADGILGGKETSMDDQLQAVRDAWYEQNATATSATVSISEAPGWIQAVYADHIIVQQGTKWLRVPYGKDAEGKMSFGQPVEVEMTYTPVTQKQGNRVAIYKQADGAYRWVGIVSNKYRDRDNPPEILSSKAHHDFVARADAKGEYPELWLWHVPGSKVGQADWLEFDGSFLLSSGTFDKGFEDVAERLAASEKPLTMSHGFYRLAHNSKDVVTDAYWMFEESVLPEGTEANPWTRFDPTVKEAVMPISDKKRPFLTEALGEERVAAIESTAEGMKADAEASGADFKETEEPTLEPAEATASAPAVDTAAMAETVLGLIVDKLSLKELSEMTADQNARIATLEATVKEQAAEIVRLKEMAAEHKADDDAKVAKALTPKVAEVFTWANYSASKSPETVLKADDPVDEKLKSAKPTGFDAFVGSLVGQMGKGG